MFAFWQRLAHAAARKKEPAAIALWRAVLKIHSPDRLKAGQDMILLLDQLLAHPKESPK